MTILKALGLSATSFIILSTIGSIFAFLPDFNNPSIIGLITVWSLSLIISAGNFINRLRPSLTARFLILFNVANFLLAIAILGLTDFVSGWLWVLILLSLYILAWILPITNPRTAKDLNDLQYFLKPSFIQSRLRRPITIFSVIGLGLISILLCSLTSHSLLQGRSLGMLLIGIIGSILAIGGGQNFAYQLWMERQKPS